MSLLSNVPSVALRTFVDSEGFYISPFEEKVSLGQCSLLVKTNLATLTPWFPLIEPCYFLVHVE